MPWSIGLLLGDSVIEMTGRADNSPQSPVAQSRAVISSGSPDAALQGFITNNNIDKIDTVWVSSNAPWHWLDARLGTPPAVLTTSGFESYLEINRPKRQRFFSSVMQKAQLPVDSEMIFGVSERTNAEGHIERIVDEQELEFLAAKLELHKTKDIALCFLHAKKNAENEKRTAHFFTARGFTVHISSQQLGQNDLEQFENAILNAYLSPLTNERFQQIKSGLSKAIDETTEFRFAHGPVMGPTLQALTFANSLVEYIQRNFAQTTTVLYCGLEELILIEKTVHKRIQPNILSKIGRSFFSEVALTNEKISFDPGPVLMGRGLVPTLFDLLGTKNTDVTIEGLSEKWTDKSKARLAEALSAYCRNLSEEQNFRVEQLSAELIDLAAFLWREEIGLAKHVTLMGPLAKWVERALTQVKSNDFNLESVGDSYFVSRSLLAATPAVKRDSL